MSNYGINDKVYNFSYEVVKNETVNHDRLQSIGAQNQYKPLEIINYIQFQINSFNKNSRKLYELMATECTIKNIKEKASATILVFLQKLRVIFDVSVVKRLFDNLKGRPKELTKEPISFYSEIALSLQITYYSLIWLFVNDPNDRLNLNCDEMSSAGNVNAKGVGRSR
ncbi:MAG: hypothetical protein HQK97_03375 [Nitrospirae bacterium]|nr:hypothetical protein [Nitrospirota bacterium]